MGLIERMLMGLQFVLGHFLMSLSFSGQFHGYKPPIGIIFSNIFFRDLKIVMAVVSDFVIIYKNNYLEFLRFVKNIFRTYY